MLKNKNSFLQIIMHTWSKPYHKHHLKILLYVLCYTTLSWFCPSLKPFQHANTSYLYTSKAVRPNWKYKTVGIAALRCPLSHFPPRIHTSRALLGLALTWPQAGHSVGSTASLTSLFSTEPGCALPQTPLQHPRLNNREQSGARDSRAHSLALSWKAETNAPREVC